MVFAWHLTRKSLLLIRLCQTAAELGKNACVLVAVNWCLTSALPGDADMEVSVPTLNL